MKVKRVLFQTNEDCVELLDGGELLDALPPGITEMSLDVLDILPNDLLNEEPPILSEQPVPHSESSAGPLSENGNSVPVAAANFSIASDEFNPPSCSTFSKIREIVAESSKPMQLLFKLSLDDKTSRTISLKKVGKPVNFATYQLKKVMNDGHGPLPISAAGNNNDDEDTETITLPQPGRERKRRARKTTKKGSKKARQATESDEEEMEDDVDYVPF